MLKPQASWRKEAALWALSLAMAMLLVAPLIVHGISEVGAHWSIPAAEPARVPPAFNVPPGARPAVWYEYC